MSLCNRSVATLQTYRIYMGTGNNNEQAGKTLGLDNINLELLKYSNFFLTVRVTLLEILLLILYC